MKKLIVIILITIFAFLYIIQKPDNTYAMKEDISSKLIRFHVIANSDSIDDQSVKLKVRDAIMKTMNGKFVGINNRKDSEKMIKDSLPEIQKIADNILKQNGKNYSAKAIYGRFDFPTKYYGTITLPAGKYDALRVVLGNGDGKNWWCVMFPPLCFIDITHGLSSDETKDELKRYLSEDELDMIETKKPPVKFKIVEVFKEYYDDIRMAFND